jgi:hypothetical protein
MIVYGKNEPLKNQFKEYVRMNGYSKYDYRELDPYLLTTLTTWDNKHPEEVKSLFSNMWNAIKPNDDILTCDILRSNIFERCYTVFSVSPQCFDKLFVKWIKRKLVDNSVTQHSGDMVRSLSLNPMVPFLYCLLGAEKVSIISANRCDDIVKRAISMYTAEGYLIESAAKLFTNNKGLSAIKPPVDLYEPHYLQNWQIGVIEASTKEILSMIMGEGQKENNPKVN